MNLEQLEKIIADIHSDAWYHAIEGQKLLSKIRDIETLIKAEIKKEADDATR
jgi:hypothetical protein